MTSSKKPVVRRDATGHLDPEYERKLREASLGSSNHSTDKAFWGASAASDELAEELGETFVQAATSGEDAEGDRHERVMEEEAGGPVVPATARQGGAGGADGRN